MTQIKDQIILEYARNVGNHLNVSSSPTDLTSWAQYLVPHLDVVDGAVVLVGKDGSPRTSPSSIGDGVDVPFSIERFVVEELVRDEPRARWRPYP